MLSSQINLYLYHIEHCSLMDYRIQMLFCMDI